MKKALLFAFAVTAVLLTAFTPSGKKYQTKNGKIDFYSEAPMENIEAWSKSLLGMIDPQSNKVAFTVFINSFEFKKDLMQKHFNENYMESEKYPKASFVGKINEDVNLLNKGIYKVNVTGKMNIHGVEKEYTLPGEIVVNEGRMNLTSNFKVKLADHNIEIPQVVVQNIAEIIDVKVFANFTLEDTN